MALSSSDDATHDLILGGGLEKSVEATVLMTSFHLVQSQFSKRSTLGLISSGLKPVNTSCEKGLLVGGPVFILSLIHI